MKMIKEIINEYKTRRTYIVGESTTSWSHKIEVRQTLLDGKTIFDRVERYQANVSYDADGAVRIVKASTPYKSTSKITINK
jgi:hypothetical protein